MKYLLLLLPLNCLGATVSTQSKEPWKIERCDRTWVEQMPSCRPAKDVRNTSIWNPTGHPLWKVGCSF